MVFKFRAEMFPDARELLGKIPDKELISFSAYLLDQVLPDVEVSISLRTIGLNELKNIMREIEDSHVMIQTVASEKDFTGERNFELTIK